MSKNIKFTLVTIVLLNCTLSCSTLTKKETWKHSAVFISDQKIKTLQNKIAMKIEPTHSIWLQTKKRCDHALNISPKAVERWAIPGFYDDPELQQKLIRSLQEDAISAYEEALCYRLTGEDKYARKTKDILSAWMSTLKSSDTNQSDSKLSMSELFPMMIAAADLVHPYSGWDLKSKDKFNFFLRKIILPLNSMLPKKNNHANWGTLLVLSSAAYLDDAELFKVGENRLKELIDTQIKSDGTLPMEMDRSDTKNWHGGPTKGKNGIWYTNYALMPTTLSAEILLLNGVRSRPKCTTRFA